MNTTTVTRPGEPEYQAAVSLAVRAPSLHVVTTADDRVAWLRAGESRPERRRAPCWSPSCAPVWDSPASGQLARHRSRPLPDGTGAQIGAIATDPALTMYP